MSKKSTQRTRRLSSARGESRSGASGSVNSHFISGRNQPAGIANDLAPGTRLSDRFEIIRRLGSGSFGTVYLARDNLRSEEVALKVAEIGPSGVDLAALQLKQEPALHTRIADHAHVVHVHDVHPVRWGGAGLLLLSMEFADGGNFRAWLLNEKQNPETRQTEGVELFKQICQGVGAVHDAGLPHLDLKPENFLFADGAIKVSDFGIAAWVQNLVGSSASYCDHLPPHIGTPVYMSPEHFAAPHPDGLDVRSDIYSLGVVLHEILHPKCRPPFGGSFLRLREMHTQAAIPDIPDVTDLHRHVITRCLQKRPEDRYQSVRELMDELAGNKALAPVVVDEDTPEAVDLDSLWASASQSFSDGKLNEAMRISRAILDANGGHVEARLMLDDLQCRYDQAKHLYESVGREMDKTDILELGALIAEAIQLYPDHPSGVAVQTRIAVRLREYKSSIDKGIDAIVHGNFEAALMFFRKAQKVNPGSRTSAEAVSLVSNALDIDRMWAERVSNPPKGTPAVRVITERGKHTLSVLDIVLRLFTEEREVIRSKLLT